MNETELVSEIPGFSSVADNPFINTSQYDKKGSRQSSGNFKCMGLNELVLKGLRNKGYKVPTPIQRKTIPLIMEGRDVVAMAKTGSGKTACFVIPMLEKFVPHSGSCLRAIVFCPTRELAVQTFRHCRELGKHINVNITAVMGGDSMESQFGAIHNHPDIIIATPGRFLHLCVEMEMQLNKVEYVVFDEADRLFEMGFSEQLKEILRRLPDSKQTVMFSATMPKSLVEFAEVGLRHPVLTRLDVESKLPETLVLKFLHCRSFERYAALIVLLKYIIQKESQIIIFAATHHHIDLLTLLLTRSGISNTFVYSSLDASARKINTGKFVNKKVSVLVVTDIAARGLDIPSLDVVINFHFPGTPKLFIHRVGRCARAGQSGIAFSLFASEDEPHLLDLHMFLNRPVNLSDNKTFGSIPQDLIDEAQSELLDCIKESLIDNAHDLSEKAYKKYVSSRPVASTESNKKVKSIDFSLMQPLEEFSMISKDLHNNKADTIRAEKHEMLLKMKNYRPSETIFELNPQKKSFSQLIMKEKRYFHSNLIQKHRSQCESVKRSDKFHSDENDELPVNTNTIVNRFLSTNKPYFVPYEPADKHTEEGLNINSFAQQARNVEFSVVDKNDSRQYVPGMKKWDRIKKKMVSTPNPKTGRIKTESGLWIPATYKTGRYADWKQKSKIEAHVDREDNENSASSVHPVLFKKNQKKIHKHNRRNLKGGLAELKSSEQITKKRLRVERAKKRELENKMKKMERTRKRTKRSK